MKAKSIARGDADQASPRSPVKSLRVRVVRMTTAKSRNTIRRASLWASEMLTATGKPFEKPASNVRTASVVTAPVILAR